MSCMRSIFRGGREGGVASDRIHHTPTKSMAKRAGYRPQAVPGTDRWRVFRKIPVLLLR